MTLKEYFAQENPVRMPKVVLSENEFKKAETHKRADRTTRTRVTIFFPDDCDIWRRNEYAQINNDPQLMTTDMHGNPQAYSCFYLPKQ